MCSSFFFSSRRRHTRCLSDWSSDVCSSDLGARERVRGAPRGASPAGRVRPGGALPLALGATALTRWLLIRGVGNRPLDRQRSEEHTSELQSLRHLVCRLLLEKKKKQNKQLT